VDVAKEKLGPGPGGATYKRMPCKKPSSKIMNHLRGAGKSTTTNRDLPQSRVTGTQILKIKIYIV